MLDGVRCFENIDMGQALVNGVVVGGGGDLCHGAQRDCTVLIVQIPGEQHEGRHIRRGGPLDGS